jgi:hypothetical protein
MFVTKFVALILLFLGEVGTTVATFFPLFISRTVPQKDNTAARNNFHLLD